MDDDDDFEDLFSFGTTTPGASTEPANQPTSTSSSDFDILIGVSLSSPPQGQGGGGGVTPGADTTDNGQGGSVMNTPRSTEVDEFDALFGTPPVTSATPSTPLGGEVSSTEKDTLLSIDELPNRTAPKHTAQNNTSSFDDFHVHDEDTRDMLDWLDDDHPTGKKATNKDDSSFSDINSNVSGDAGDKNNEDTSKGGGFGDDDDDDFDFDAMLADVDATPSPKSAVKVVETEKHDVIPTKKIEGTIKAVPAVVAEKPPEENTTIANPDITSNIDDPAPVIESKQFFSAGIEEELAFDQWEDDAEEEMEDLQLADSGNDVQQVSPAIIDGGDAINGSSTGKEEGGATEVDPPPLSSKKITFSSLADAIRSNASTTDDIRALFSRERGHSHLSGDIGVGEEDRAYLWSKVICGKILGDVVNRSSLADSYREWEKKGEAATKLEGVSVNFDTLIEQACGMNKEDEDYQARKRQVISLSYFHSRKKSSTCPTLDGIDPLIPPVAIAILQAGIPPAAASVVLSQIEPSVMPLLRLGNSEQFLAAKALHSEFYLLACYHLPLLVMHLDRHCPGWYWPRRGNMDQHGDEQLVNDNAKGQEEKSNEKAEESNPESNKKKHEMEENGLVPLSWFVTNFAGEYGGSCLNHNVLLKLWDHVLTKGDYSWKYFLAIAVLEKKSDVLLMSRGDELKKELEKIVDFQEDAASSESFVGASEGQATSSSDDGIEASEWLSSARSLMEATPASVIGLLRSADDRAVTSALKARQMKIDKELQAELDAHEVALKKERDERDKETERALNKARLTAYYRTYNPEKVDTIDQILKLFDGRMGVLNEKLKKKYGKGFLPDEALKDQTRSFLVSVNQSYLDTKKHVSVAVERRKKNAKSIPEGRSYASVVLEVSTTEVIPVICTTKGHNLASGRKMCPAKRTSNTDSSLQFYLVDCRPESIASEQGRFPTSVALSPEKLQDPDELQKLTDMFESLRGAVHICVMGEGFASFPVLYNHKLSTAEQKLLEDDVSRISNCALFFLKKGFPFVSVLRGGFAAAHAFLSRNEIGMSPSDVLVEYDPDISLFAQLETARQEEEQYKNAPAREKTARSLQKIIDNSMVRLTMEEQRINNLANNLAKAETRDKMKQSVSNFLKKPGTVGLGRAPPLFITKKFTSAKVEQSEKKIENSTKEEGKPSATQDEASDKPALSPTNKISFNMPSLHSIESSSSSLLSVSIPSSEKESKDDKEIAETVPKSAQVEASDNTSKISSAFTSLTQRVQQSTTNNSTSIPAEGSEEPAPDKASAKIPSFSSFANRIKKAAEGLEEKKDSSSTTEKSSETTLPTKEEKDEGKTSPSKVTAAKMSSAFASLSQRMQQSATTSTFASESETPSTEGETAKRESSCKISFSTLTNKIKINQPADQLTTDNAADTDASAKPITEKSEDETPKTVSRFSIQNMSSISGGLSGIRDKVSEAKSVATKEEGNAVSPADGARLSKFTKSIGGSLSGYSLSKKPEQKGEKSDFTKTLTSLGKFISEEAPRPMTRFERMAAEESISFGNEDTDTVFSSQDGGGEFNDLLLGFDAEPNSDLFADVSLTDSGEDKEKAVNPKTSSNETEPKSNE